MLSMQYEEYGGVEAIGRSDCVGGPELMDEVVDWERRTTHGSLDLDGCTEQSWWRSSSELVCYSSKTDVSSDNVYLVQSRGQ